MSAAKKKSSKKAKISKKIVVSKKRTEYKSFKISRGTKPFFMFLFTEQTVYWLILVTSILIMWLWDLSVQLDAIHAVNNIIKLY